MTSSRSDIPSHIDVLDGLRAVAILLVMATHSLAPYWLDLQKPFLPIGPFDIAIFLRNGWCGVDLFFVLSGFLITLNLDKINLSLPFKSRVSFIADFYKRRFFRIAPAYYLVLTLTCLGVLSPLPVGDPDTVWGWRYIYHLLFLQDYLPPDIVSTFWSLAIEFKFYLLAPFILLFLSEKKTTTRCYLILGLIAAVVAARFATTLLLFDGIDDYQSYFYGIRNQFHLSLDGLLAGMLGATIWQDDDLRRRFTSPRVSHTLFYGGIALLLLLTTIRVTNAAPISFFHKTLLPSSLTASFFLIMMGLLGCQTTIKRLFSARPLKGLARISYSVYLLHTQLVYVALYIVNKIVPGQEHMTLKWALSLPFFLFFCLVFSTILYLTVEKPLIDWSKQSRRLPNPVNPAA